MKNTFKKMKEWTKNHSDELIGGGMIVAGVALYGGLMAYIVKAYREHNQLIADAVADGKTILPNPDGSVWILDLK